MSFNVFSLNKTAIQVSLDKLSWVIHTGRDTTDR